MEFGNGETIAAGLFKFKAAGPRRSLVTAGASFQPPFSRRLGGGAGGAPDIPAAERPRGGGGGTMAAATRQREPSDAYDLLIIGGGVAVVVTGIVALFITLGHIATQAYPNFH